VSPRFLNSLAIRTEPNAGWVDERRQMWQQCLKTTELCIVDVRVTENAVEVAK
jgi:hypothetical protein